ncbi:MAG: hypothetical protein J6V76_07435 [Bacteroidales bacterium]|nr:hypothetical protein [Bacteroidales bacterium]
MKKIFLPTSIRIFLLIVAVLFSTAKFSYGQFKIEQNGTVVGNYTTFTGALSYINSNGDGNTTLTLLQDYRILESEYDFSIQNPITFDLNVYTLDLDNRFLYPSTGVIIKGTNATIKSSEYDVLKLNGNVQLIGVKIETTYKLTDEDKEDNMEYSIIDNSNPYGEPFKVYLGNGTDITGCQYDHTKADKGETDYASVKPVSNLTALECEPYCVLIAVDDDEKHIVDYADGVYIIDKPYPRYGCSGESFFQAKYDNKTKYFTCLKQALEYNYNSQNVLVTIKALKDKPIINVANNDPINISNNDFVIDLTGCSVKDVLAISVGNGRKLTINADDDDELQSFIQLDASASLEITGGKFIGLESSSALKIDADCKNVSISGGEFSGNPAIDYNGTNPLLDQKKKLVFCDEYNTPFIDGDFSYYWRDYLKVKEYSYADKDQDIIDYICGVIELEREYDAGIYVYSTDNQPMYNGGSPISLDVPLSAIEYQDPDKPNNNEAASDVGSNKNIVVQPNGNSFFRNGKLYLWSAANSITILEKKGSITPRVVNPQLTDENFKVRKEYDGTTDIPKELLELLNDVGFSFSEEDELASNEEVQLTFTGASFVTPDEDVAKEVAYSFELDGGDARHFKLPEDNNTMILTNGTITPRPLTDEEKSAIETKIKDCVVREKYYEEGNYDCKLKANSFVYEISDILKVTVTIEKAQYINQEGRPIREIGGPYDIVVTYHVDDNFIFGGENDVMTTQSDFLIRGEGAILKRPEAQLPEKISPMDDEVKFCAEGDGSVALNFEVVEGVAEYYKVTFEKSDVLKEQNGKVSQGNDGEYVVDIVVPSGVVPGEYTGYLVFVDETGDVVSEPYQFVLNLNMARDVVKYLYKNVIFVDNKDSLFTAYQWYKNGEPIPSSNKFHNRQYYTEEYKDLDGVYYVDITTNAGIKLKTCPLAGKGLVGKRSIASVKVYPNPAKANVPFTLQLVDENGFDESFYAGAEILIYTNNGTLVKRISQVGKTISVTLPSGYYSGALINGGSKSGFKIVVE